MAVAERYAHLGAVVLELDLHDAENADRDYDAYGVTVFALRRDRIAGSPGFPTSGALHAARASDDRRDSQAARCAA